jgi:hypothetical protein
MTKFIHHLQLKHNAAPHCDPFECLSVRVSGAKESSAKLTTRFYQEPILPAAYLLTF